MRILFVVSLLIIAVATSQAFSMPTFLSVSERQMQGAQLPQACPCDATDCDDCELVGSCGMVNTCYKLSTTPGECVDVEDNGCDPGPNCESKPSTSCVGGDKDLCGP
jgi:hypothetical protein